MPTGPVYAFGSFQLDAGAHRLRRDGEPLPLSDRQLAVLSLLVARAGKVVAKDELIEAGWADVAVTDNSLEQAISNMRRVLGPAEDGEAYIETLPRRGYRFRGTVTQLVVRENDQSLLALLEPYRMFVEGRTAVETLEAEALGRARTAFEAVCSSAPDYAPGHIGLANALALIFESTRADDVPDVNALSAAILHAREACRLDADGGEAWATLAFVLSRAGADMEAVAAGRRALALEPDNWRHHIRVAYSAWGEERLRAADRVLKLIPGLALAHWLAATVHVARQAFDVASRELALGIQHQQQSGSGRFGAVGLRLLNGLIRLTQGQVGEAEAELSAELAEEASGHAFSRQASANAWCAIGALRAREGRGVDAAAAFDEACARVPGHPLALAAMAVVADRPRRSAFEARLAGRLDALAASGRKVETAMVRGVGAVLGGRHAEAAQLVYVALQTPKTGGSAGWTIPVEPLLDVASHEHEWAAVLAALRARAA